MALDFSNILAIVGCLAATKNSEEGISRLHGTLMPWLEIAWTKCGTLSLTVLCWTKGLWSSGACNSLYYIRD